MDLLQYVAEQLANRRAEQIDRDLGYDVIKSSKRIVIGNLVIFFYKRNRVDRIIKDHDDQNKAPNK